MDLANKEHDTSHGSHVHIREGWCPLPPAGLAGGWAGHPHPLGSTCTLRTPESHSSVLGRQRDACFPSKIPATLALVTPTPGHSVGRLPRTPRISNWYRSAGALWVNAEHHWGSRL
eukprot:gene24336-biopygen14942